MACPEFDCKELLNLRQHCRTVLFPPPPSFLPVVDCESLEENMPGRLGTSSARDSKNLPQFIHNRYIHDFLGAAAEHLLLWIFADSLCLATCKPFILFKAEEKKTLVRSS
jgi:hypothetical protein